MWWIWWRTGGPWISPYPGHGPWRYLPPPMRPGWRLWAPWTYTLGPAPWVSYEDELRYLEDLRRYITEYLLKEIDARIDELKKLLEKK
ncbi:MAG: hypothetical protein ACP5I7_01940 [Sulfolobales archaeon]